MPDSRGISLFRSMLGLLLAAVASVAAMQTGAAAQDGFESTTTLQVTTSSLGSTTSSSMLEDYDNEVLYALFPSRPAASVTVRIRAYPDYGPDDAYCAYYPPNGPPVGFSGLTTLEFDAFAGGVLDQSQALVVCSYYTHEPHGPMGTFRVTSLSATDADGNATTVGFCEIDYSEDMVDHPYAGACRHACGDAECDGTLRTNDSLAVLRASVALRSCPPRICDTNHDGAVSSTDALRVLRRALGSKIRMLCQSPC